MRGKIIVMSLGLVLIASAAQAAAPNGKALFRKNCAACHVNGGNVVNPKFTLSRKDRYAHGVKTVGDIVKKMRNPGPGMTKFTKKMVSDKDAMAIAKYIMKTFK